MLEASIEKKTVTKRLSAYLPDTVYEWLEDWAGEEKRSISSLVSFLLESAVRQRQEEKKVLTQSKRGEE